MPKPVASAKPANPDQCSRCHVYRAVNENAGVCCPGPPQVIVVPVVGGYDTRTCHGADVAADWWCPSFKRGKARPWPKPDAKAAG